jgi:hypothetical protein
MATESRSEEEAREGTEPATEVQSAADAGRDAQAGGGGEALGGPVGDELSAAGAEAGDPAAAGTDAEGTWAGGPHQAHQQGGRGDVSAEPLAERAEGIAEQHPEVLVGAAFLGGLVIARLLAAVGGDR